MRDSIFSFSQALKSFELPRLLGESELHYFLSCHANTLWAWKLNSVHSLHVYAIDPTACPKSIEGLHWHSS